MSSEEGFRIFGGGTHTVKMPRIREMVGDQRPVWLRCEQSMAECEGAAEGGGWRGFRS